MSTKSPIDFMVATVGESSVQGDTAYDLSIMLARLGFRSEYVSGGSSWKVLFPRALSRLDPRCVIVVNFARPHFGSVFDDVPIVATWLQDSTSAFHKPGLSSHWNGHCGRDRVFGYISSAVGAGLDPKRVFHLPFFIDPVKFSPGLARGTGVFAAMSKGEPVSSFLKETRRGHPDLFSSPMTIGLWLKLAEALSEFCLEGGRLWNFSQLAAFAEGMGGPVARAWPYVRGNPQLRVLGYWHVYERVYRQTVLKWLLGSGIDFKVAGDGWKGGSMFANVSMGALPRDELGAWYSSSDWSLHVNNHKGYHHRYVEVLLSGGSLLAHGDPVPFKPFDRASFVKDQEACLLELAERLLDGGLSLDGGRVARLYDVMDKCVYFRNKEELLALGKEGSSAFRKREEKEAAGVAAPVQGVASGQGDGS